MNIKAFFHKLKTGFVRMGASSIPPTSPEKQYGNWGEDEFVFELKRYLPDCHIKRNIVIQTSEGNAEIDCLILYKTKLFAVEVKRWKGCIEETEQGFVKRTVDRWTGEIHTKYLKSPFKQLKRAVYLLRKQIQPKAWLNTVVFFEDAEEVSVSQESIWFTEISDLVRYILNDGRNSCDNCASLFFEQCVSADHLYSDVKGKSLHCIIDDTSLQFDINGKCLSRQDISFIRIQHHWSYDTLQIVTHDKFTYCIDLENASIAVTENGRQSTYAICKLDFV